jgi:hypothetical protein
MKGQKQPSAAEFVCVKDGPYASVRLAPDRHKEYMQLFESNDQLSKKRRKHLERYFDRFCEIGPQALGEDKFKFEDSFPDGQGKQVPVYTFKSFQLRLYGGILTVAGKRCFVGVRSDLSRKSDKADQQLLKSAANDIALLLEYRKK